ncbi:Unknown protein, partial [Striga hermonthica]
IAELESRQRAPEDPPRRASTSAQVYLEADSPLTPELTSEPVPGKVKVPQIGLYDGTSDPDSHLGHYTSWMDLHGASDALRCRMFSLTLGPRAQKWYHSLPPHSIWKWQQLRSAFRSHFIGAQVCLIPKESLANITQKDDESVKDYIARFNDRVQNMEPCHPETLLVMAIAGLKPNSIFRWTLCQNKPNTFQEFLARAQQHIIAEEAMSVPDFNFNPKSSKAGTDEKRKNKFFDKQNKTQFRGPPRGDPNDLEVRAARKQYATDVKSGYQTVYSAGAATIYEEIKGKGILPDTKPLRMPEEKLDKSRYCDYHKSPGHNTDESAVSIFHYALKFPTTRGEGTHFEDQREARELVTFIPSSGVHSTSMGNNEASPQQHASDDTVSEEPNNHVGDPSTSDPLTEDRGRRPGKEPLLEEDELDPRALFKEKSRADRAEPGEDVELVYIDEPVFHKSLRIGSHLQEPLRSELISFLKQNSDVFSWKHENMKGIDPGVASHKLNLDRTIRPVVQKRRKLGPDRQKALEEEVKKLIDNKFIKEAKYPTWVSNPVLVKKSNGLWRLCIDFSDLNKACPKDSYPLPHIDYMVDATSGHELMSFMDAYSGYNQIPMDPEDSEHTSFYSARGLYCYTMMPFGLKNAGVNKMFATLIGHTMEVYVDDMLVKSVHASDHITHLQDMFSILRSYSMVLNPKKCTFGVESGKFLGYMVSQRGIEANPAKIKAIQELTPPTSVKGVQALTGRLAALNRFISKSTDRCRPFFEAIKKEKRFEWTEECQKALDSIKKALVSPPTFQKPKPEEMLFLYLGVSDSAISAVLIREEGLLQSPIYYVSKALHDAELRYPPMEKLAFALVIAARKLRPYFQEHSVTVRTSYPLRQILHRPDTSGRMVKWAIELGQFDIHYQPRTAIMAQALSDFIAEFTPAITVHYNNQPWVLYIDGSSTANRAGAGIVLADPENQLF